MKYAVFIVNPNTGRHYRRSVWYSDPHAAELCRDSWSKDVPWCEPIIVMEEDD